MRTIPSDLLRFQDDPSPVETALVSVWLKAKNVPIGHIGWAPAWKQYAFFPAEGSGLTYRVAGDIATQLVSMMDEWAKAAGRKPTHGKNSAYRPRQKRCGAKALRQWSSTGGAIKAGGTQEVICGRWLGHDGPHQPMGSKETWEG